MTSAMTVDRGFSATGSWEMVARRPGLGLEAVVSDYGGYREEGTTPLRRREVTGGDGVGVDVERGRGPSVGQASSMTHASRASSVARSLTTQL